MVTDKQVKLVVDTLRATPIKQVFKDPGDGVNTVCAAHLVARALGYKGYTNYVRGFVHYLSTLYDIDAGWILRMNDSDHMTFEQIAKEFEVRYGQETQ